LHFTQRAHLPGGWFVRWAALALLFAVVITLRNAPQLPQAFLSRGMEALLALLPIVPVVTALTRRRNRRGPASEVAVVALAVLGTTVVGLSIRTAILMYVERTTVPSGFWFVLLGRWFEYSVLGTIIALIAVFHERIASAEDALHTELLQQVHLEHQLAEARLQSLQSQIEPHFLFNTLANVRRLFQTEPGSGRAMLGRLAHHLAVSLPRLRAAEVPLGEEVALIEAYLQIHAIRMGTRLQWRLDVDDLLAGAAVPPMMLSTLVENAIKHGLSPLPEGGKVSIRASLNAKQLRLEVADDGQGFTGSAGPGVGLANIRTRLQLLYGGTARLDFAANRPRGVVAAVELPYHTARTA
jgi:hypothetical protein